MNAGGDGSPSPAENIDLPCKEFSEFKVDFQKFVDVYGVAYFSFLQFALQQARTIDDKIVYNLNTSVPTQSFAGQVSAREQCMSLYKEVLFN